MSIRFKFRSSVSFDSVDIGGRPSISVRELRSKIIRHKNLNLCQDFDLVFSDPVTGRDYNDESFQIPSNSSVIIKRVPAGSVPSALPIGSVEKLGMKSSKILGEKSEEMDDFDDFGIDLCPVPEEIFPYSDLEVDKKNEYNNEKTTIAGERLGCHKLQVSGLSKAIPRGSNHSGFEGNTPQKKLETKVEEHMKFRNGRVVGPNALAEQNADLTSELKCSLCNAFFKDAVMIPCCQHSFCEKCIRGVLIEKAKCPKCSSCKFRVEDLLPNLSLRQAIEHFLESQNLVSASENALREYAPDGESGIQAKDFSCAVTIAQKRPDYPLSPSATEKGSNQIMGESFCAESLIRKNASLEGSGFHINNLAPSKVLKTVPSFHNIKKTGGERDGYAHHLVSQSGPGYTSGVEFQGENELHLPRCYLHEEGGGRSFPAAARYRKTDRTCYMCGAPDHFIRDCPYAASPHPMLQSGNTMYPGGMPGFASPYWSGTAFAPMRPFNSMYGNPGMMPFNASMVPVTPFGVSPYMSSMYGHLPVPGGMTRMGILAPPVGNRAENPVTHSEFLELRDCESRGQLSNEYLMRRQPPCDEEDEDLQKGFRHNVPAGSHEYKSHIVREKSGSYSGDNHTQRSRRKHHHDKHLDHDVHSVHDRHGKNSHSSRDRRPYHSERSNSVVDDVSNSSDKYDDGRYKQHRISRKHHERKGQCGSDSSWSRHQRQKEKDVKSRVDYDEKGFNQKRGSQLGSGVELSLSGDQKKQSKERDHNRGSRHSRDGAKRSRHESCDDRRKTMTPDEDCREGNRHPKRKRIH